MQFSHPQCSTFITEISRGTHKHAIRSTHICISICYIWTYFISTSNFIHPIPELVSTGAISQTEWFRITYTYYLIVLEVRSLKGVSEGWNQGVSHLRICWSPQGRTDLAFAASGGDRHSLAHGPFIPPSAKPVMWGQVLFMVLSLCFSLFCFSLLHLTLKDSFLIILGQGG